MKMIKKWTLLMMALAGACLNMMGQEAKDSTVLRPTFGATLTSDIQTDFKETRMQHLLELSAEVPLSRKVTLQVSSMSAMASDEEWLYYDMQGFSNIDCYEDVPFALTVAGLEWKINDRHTLFAGIRRTDEDYFCSDALGMFTNSSCGIFPTLSWNYIVNTYPEAALGVHYAYDDERWRLQASIYNGVGNHDFKGRYNVFRFCPKDDGLLALGQVEYRWRGSSYYLGASMHTEDEAPYTMWAYAEQKLWPNVTLLATYGHGFGEDNLCDNFYGGGVTMTLKNWDLAVFTDYMKVLGYGQWSTEIGIGWHLSEVLTIQPVLHIMKQEEEDTKLMGLMRFCVEL